MHSRMVSVPVNLVGVSCCHPLEGRFCCSLLGPNIDTGRRIEDRAVAALRPSPKLSVAVGEKAVVCGHTLRAFRREWKLPV